jgi:hypothetical protein
VYGSNHVGPWWLLHGCGFVPPARNDNGSRRPGTIAALARPAEAVVQPVRGRLRPAGAVATSKARAQQAGAIFLFTR